VIARSSVSFFVLEGFPCGVGVLHTLVGRTDTERQVALNDRPWWGTAAG
jgi:cytochrome d ubiquinol oxidase subunit II